MKDVGNICKCVVEHDNKGLGSSWYLQYVEIKKDSQTYRFAQIVAQTDQFCIELAVWSSISFSTEVVP